MKRWRDFLTAEQRVLVEHYEEQRDRLRLLRPEYRRVMQNAMHRAHNSGEMLMKKKKPKHKKQRKFTMKGLRRPRSQAEGDVRNSGKR